MQNLSKVNYAALQVQRHKKCSWSEAMTTGWAISRKHSMLLRFKKTNGDIAVRVVDPKWLDYYTPTGTGHPAPKDSLLFADLVRVELKLPPIISAKEALIVDLI